jgi:hypothetical protein
MDEATRSDERAEVMRDAHGPDGAPSWLWASVVELAGRHEIGYLQPCHLYATEEDA